MQAGGRGVESAMLRPRTGPEGELSPVASSTESHFVLIGQDTLGQRRLAGNARADGGGESEQGER